MEDKPLSTHDELRLALVDATDEIAQLRNTIASMRDQMDAMRFSEQQAVQRASSAGGEEIVQLRATVQALRDEMERLKSRFDDETQNLHAAARSEARLLHLTIVELRQQLEGTHAG